MFSISMDGPENTYLINSDSNIHTADLLYLKPTDRKWKGGSEEHLQSMSMEEAGFQPLIREIGHRLPSQSRVYNGFLDSHIGISSEAIRRDGGEFLEFEGPFKEYIVRIGLFHHCRWCKPEQQVDWLPESRYGITERMYGGAMIFWQWSCRARNTRNISAPACKQIEESCGGTHHLDYLSIRTTD